jgi:hypothetical protein
MTSRASREPEKGAGGPAGEPGQDSREIGPDVIRVISKSWRTYKMIPQVAQDYIKECVSKEMSGKATDMKFYIRSMVECWDMDDFNSKQDAEIAYSQFAIACRIRTWCRRNGYATRRGSRHIFNCQRDNKGIWEIVNGTDIEGEANGVRWAYRYVDQIRNVYVSF